MGDRTPIEFIVYSCPPERVNAVLEVFEEFGLGHEFVLPGDPAPGPANASRQRRLELGRGYIHSEISVGSSAEIAAALPSDAAWKVWEDRSTSTSARCTSITPTWACSSRTAYSWGT